MDGTPTIVSLTPANTTIQIAFTYAGLTTPDDFAYSLNDGSFVSMGTVVSPYTITGLTNGQSYSVVVVASINQTDYSAPSNAMVAVPRTVPDAPTIDLYIPGNGSLRIAVSPPASNGGSSITGYEYEITHRNPSGCWPIHYNGSRQRRRIPRGGSRHQRGGNVAG